MTRIILKRAIPLLCVCVFITCVSCGRGSGKSGIQSEIVTGKLLIFYSWPNAINGAASASDPVSAAAAEYGKYDYVVLNRTFGGSDCPQSTVTAIINHPSCAGTEFFGYIDLGMLSTSQRLAMTEIDARITSWNEMGADGIFFDEFGYDYDVTRDRQNQAIDAVHEVVSKRRGRQLSVVANAWNLEDVFGSETAPMSNPAGAASRMGANDYFLLESFFISEGEYVDDMSGISLAAAIDKMSDARKYGASHGSMPLTITTNADTAQYDQNKFLYSWYASVILGSAGAGWGEYVFSAAGSAVDNSPFRARPSAYFGSHFTGEITVSGNMIQRKTDTGLLFINTSDHSYGFKPD